MKPTKHCAICDTEFTPNNSRGTTCSVGCRKEAARRRARKWYRDNPERATQSRAAWRAKNRDKVLERNKQYYGENREEILADMAKYREANRERINAYFRRVSKEKSIPSRTAEYSQAIKEKFRDERRAQKREYYYKNREARRAAVRRYREENPEKIREYNRLWRANNPDRRRELAQAREARIAGSFVETVTRQGLIERYGAICHICKGEIPADVDSTHPLYFNTEHVIPLIHGGTHGYENCRPSHASCNMQKNDRLDGWQGIKPRIAQ